jgi:peptide/nickel transport system substrate-binding protein
MTLREHPPALPSLLCDVARGRLTRRDALKRASLLGLSATALAGLASVAPIRSAAALPARQDGPPVRGGSVRVALPGSASGFDPAVNTTLEELCPLAHLYSNLVRMTPDQELEPDLALSWSANDTADQWTFTLRQGVTFHDGGAFSSEDVVATIAYHLNPDTASTFRNAISMIERVEAISPTEVVFHLAYPFVEFPELMSNYQGRMLPAGRMSDLALKPVGTGPYVLDAHVPGERTVIRRFDGYFDLEGQGFLDEIEFMAIPEEATKVAALTSGGIELANEYLPTSLPSLESAPTVATTEIMTGNHQPIVMDVTQAPFDDNRVRTALKLCVERDGMIAVVLQGHGVHAADQVVPPHDPMYGDITIPAQDLERARALLAEAGHPDGLDLVLHTSPGRAGMLESALTFKDMAVGAGVRVDIVTHPIDVFWADIWKKTPFFMSNWLGRPTADQMLSQAYTCGASWEESNWCNEEFDSRIMAARAALDPEERRQLLTDAQQILAEDGPVIVPYFRSYITAFTNRLHGFRADPMRILDLRRAWLDG